MIIITPKKDPVNCLVESNGAIDVDLRRRCISFTNLLNYIKPYINKYYKEINIDDLNMTKEYLFNKSKEMIEELKISEEKKSILLGFVDYLSLRTK